MSPGTSAGSALAIGQQPVARVQRDFCQPRKFIKIEGVQEILDRQSEGHVAVNRETPLKKQRVCIHSPHRQHDEFRRPGSNGHLGKRMLRQHTQPAAAQRESPARPAILKLDGKPAPLKKIQIPACHGDTKGLVHKHREHLFEQRRGKPIRGKVNGFKREPARW